MIQRHPDRKHLLKIILYLQTGINLWIGQLDVSFSLWTEELRNIIQINAQKLKTLVYGQWNTRSNLDKWWKDDGEIPLFPLQFNLILLIKFSYCTILCHIWMTPIFSVVTHLCYFIHSLKKEQRKIFMLWNVFIVVFLDKGVPK